MAETISTKLHAVDRVRLDSGCEIGARKREPDAADIIAHPTPAPE